ncbi:MAG: hypothetical protein ABIJ46_04495 [bacterium]
MTESRRKFLLVSAGLVLAVIFFFAYSFLPRSVPGIYNSPDESANAVFSVQFAADGRLYRVDELNLRSGLEGLVHPRSVLVSDGFQVPGSFIGLPVIYGLVARAVGVVRLPFLTPALALLGVLAWGWLLSRLFGRRVGVLGGLLLLVNPAWWYWSARTMMPNVAFVSLLLVAMAFVFGAPLANLARKSRGEEGESVLHADGVLAGLFLGLALAVRPVEAYWLAAAAAVIVVIRRRSLPWARIGVAAVFCLLTLLPFLVLSHSLYGSWFATGYGGLSSAVPETAHGGLGARLIGPLRPWLFPLGFAPRTALSSFWTYGLKFFWWWTVPTLLSVAFLLYGRRHARSRSSERHRTAGEFAAVAATVTAWLLVFYGSWSVQDNPDPNAVSIGSSYLRYWLPMFVASTVPLALAADRLLAARPSRLRTVAVCVSLLVLASVSAAAVYGSRQEGLVAVRSSLTGYSSDMRTVLSLTGSDAVIVADRADKFLYPYRSVIYPLRSESTYAALSVAATARPLFYYGLTLPPVDLDWLRSVRLVPQGLDIEPVHGIGENTLYRIYRTYSDRHSADQKRP